MVYITMRVRFNFQVEVKLPNYKQYNIDGDP